MKATNSSSTAKPQIEGGSASQPATKTAKLFKNGRSQAVRLPKEFRFEGTEVAIRRDPGTGEVVLTPPAAPRSMELQEWFDRFDSLDLSEDEIEGELKKLGRLTAQELFQIFDWAKFPEDFMADRETHMPRELDLF